MHGSLGGASVQERDATISRDNGGRAVDGDFSGGRSHVERNRASNEATAVLLSRNSPAGVTSTQGATTSNSELWSVGELKT